MLIFTNNSHSEKNATSLTIHNIIAYFSNQLKIYYNEAKKKKRGLLNIDNSQLKIIMKNKSHLNDSENKTKYKHKWCRKFN